MADKRTTRLFVGATALLFPAVLYTIILAMNVWKALAASDSPGEFVAGAVISFVLAGSLWLIGIVLLRRGLRSRAIEKERDRPKIIT